MRQYCTIATREGRNTILRVCALVNFVRERRGISSQPGLITLVAPLHLGMVLFLQHEALNTIFSTCRYAYVMT